MLRTSATLRPFELSAVAAVATKFDWMIEKVDCAGRGSAITCACKDGFDGLRGGSVATVGSDDCDDFHKTVSRFQFPVTRKPSGGYNDVATLKLVLSSRFSVLRKRRGSPTQAELGWGTRL
jgi:hypothetical protein